MEEKLIKEIIDYIDEKNKKEFKKFGIMYYTSGNRDFIEETKKIINQFKTPEITFKIKNLKNQKSNKLGNYFKTIYIGERCINIYDYKQNIEILNKNNMNLTKKQCVIIFKNGLD